MVHLGQVITTLVLAFLLGYHAWNPQTLGIEIGGLRLWHECQSCANIQIAEPTSFLLGLS